MPQNNPFYSLDQYITPFNGIGAPQAQQQPAYEYYKPSYEMQNRFARLLDQQPQVNQPSNWRKIGAVLSGAAAGLQGGNAMEASRNFAYAPYINQMQQWGQIAPFMQQAADNERLMNQQGLNMNNQMRTFDLNQRKQDEVERKNRETEADRIRLRNRQDKLAELEYLKFNNPNLQFKEMNGGLYVADPRTGQLTDTGIRGLSEIEKLRFLANAAMDRTMATQSGAMDRALVAQEGQNERTAATIAGAENRTRIAQEGANNRAGLTGGNNLQNPLNQARSIRLRAQEFRLRNPDLANFIEIPTSPNAPINVIQPGSKWFGRSPTQEQYNRILQGLGMGGEQSSIPPVGASVNNPSQTSNARGRATELLRQNNIPVTEANIAEMIRQAGLQ